MKVPTFWPIFKVFKSYTYSQFFFIDKITYVNYTEIKFTNYTYIFNLQKHLYM